MASLLLMKLYPPPIPAGYVVRPQLLEKLNEALSCRLTLVSAPAGAGKTTLVSAWMQAARQHEAVAFAWLSLDEADNAPDQFWEYVLACQDEVSPGLSPSRTPLEHGGIVSREQIPAGVMRGLLDLKRDFALILDDYHLIQNIEIHAALDSLLARMPPRLHLALVTRSDPPLELARLRVAGQLVEIRMDDLRFSVEEAATFLKRSTGVQLSAADVATLTTRSEGWIAGLQMAAISLRGQTDAPAFVAAFAGSHRFIVDYLLEQVLNRQPQPVREFLLKTSVLEQLSAPLCAAVTETKGARELLDTLERDNLFLVPLDEERGWYRYHHLFAGLLKLMLEQAYPGLAADLHRRASHWYAAQAMIPEALSHALAAGDLELADHLVSPNVLTLIECDGAGPILQRIDALPPEKMAHLPWLSIARAWVAGPGQVQKSHQILAAVEQNLPDMSDPAERRRLAGHLAAARVSVYNLEGNIEATVQNARVAEALLPPEEVAIRAMNLVIWGDILSKDRHAPQAMPILEHGLTLAIQAARPPVALTAGAALTLGHMGAGRFRQAERVCLDSLSLVDDYQQRSRRVLSAAAINYSLLARIKLETGETEQAVQLGHKGLALCERWGQVDSEVFCLEYLGQALLFAGYSEPGRQVLQRAQHLGRSLSPWLWQMATTFSLDSLLDCYPADSRVVQEQIEAVQVSGAAYSAYLQARLLLKQNRPEQALPVIHAALASQADQPSSSIVRLLVLSALASQAQGDEKPALAALKKALELAAPENRILPFVREGEAMVNLLGCAGAKNMSLQFTRRLLAFFDARRKAQPRPVVEALIEPLSERELQVLALLDGPLTTPEIAAHLVVSANTVRTHVKNIYSKLGVHGRSHAVERGRDLGLLA